MPKLTTHVKHVSGWAIYFDDHPPAARVKGFWTPLPPWRHLQPITCLQANAQQNFHSMDGGT